MLKQIEKGVIFIIIASTILIAVSSAADSSTTSPQYDCCFFYSDTCNSTGSWKWSYEYPSQYIPTYENNFEWSDVDGAVWSSPMYYAVNATTQFALQYFLWSTEASLDIGFKESSSGLTYAVGSLTDSNRKWLPYTFDCLSCCGASEVCDGQLTITARIPDGSQVAIDAIGRDSLCSGVLGCCTFDDEDDLCGFQSDVQDGYQWQFSVNNNATFPVPDSNTESAYLYFQAINSSGPVKVALRSELITANVNESFYTDFYNYNSYGAYGYNSFHIYFHNVDSGDVTFVFRGTSTHGQWWSYCMEYPCGAFPTCTGYIEYVAEVDLIGADVFIAIDQVYAHNACYE